MIDVHIAFIAVLGWIAALGIAAVLAYLWFSFWLMATMGGDQWPLAVAWIGATFILLVVGGGLSAAAGLW